MPLRSLVKVSHLSNLSDARYCAGMGVEMLGFHVIPGSDRYMAPSVFQEIRGWIAGPRIVAELHGVESGDEIDTAIKTYAPDALELSLEEYQRFESFLTLPCIITVSDPAQLRQISGSRVSHVVVPEHVDCTSLSDAAHAALAKVTSVERLKEQLAQGCFQGFVLEGPSGIRPGVTNYDKLGALLESLEEEW